VVGVKTGLGLEINSKAVVLTNGTFFKWIDTYRRKNFGGGRTAERAATGITEQLKN
jgi:tRNA uridine 5-carboxymethylaminomethyl modification enzyme